MATRAENIEARLDAIAAELAAMDSTRAGGLPNHSGPNSVDHVNYRLSLLQEMERLQGQLQAAQGAFEVESQMLG